MWEAEARAFYGAIITAGAVLTGFCATFLAFRIQREASYHRQPALDFATGSAKDVHIGLTHFSSAFLLLVLGSVCSALFGVVFPLLALGGAGWFLARKEMAAAGVIAGLVFIGAYFVDELVHYRIVSNRLAADASEWGREWLVVVLGTVAAVVAAALSFDLLEGAG